MEHDKHVSSDVLMKYKRQKVSVVRDFPEGCGPSTNRIVTPLMRYKPHPVFRDFYRGFGYGSIAMQSNDLLGKGEDDTRIKPSGNAVVLQSPELVESISKSEFPSFLMGETDDNDSVKEHFEKAAVHEVLEDLVQSELPYNDDSKLQPPRVPEDFAQPELTPGVESFQTEMKLESPGVVENFVKLELPDLSSARSVKPSNTLEPETTEFSRKDLVLNRCKYYPPLSLRRVSAKRDFPLGCGGNPRAFGDDPESQSHKIQVERHSEIIPEMADKEDKTVTYFNSKSYLADIKTQTVPQEGKGDVEVVHDKMRRAKDRKVKSLKTGCQDGNMIQLREEQPLSSKLHMGRVIVQALMAAPNCPWRNGKRARKPKPSGVTGSKKIH